MLPPQEEQTMETTNGHKLANAPVLTPAMTISQKADAIEEHLLEQLNLHVATSVLFTSGECDPTHPSTNRTVPPGKRALMGDDPRLPKMPDKPTLLDFFKYRFSPSQNHLLQSANLALKNGHSEKIILACLLHDIGVVGFIRSDHGYWGAQLVEPYVDEEIAWAIKAHQALRFYPDEAAGYAYPDQYVRLFGVDFTPEPYIQEEYKRLRDH